jgi:flagellar protein FlaI
MRERMPKKKKKKAGKKDELDYTFTADHTMAKVRIYKGADDRVHNYEITIPKLEEGTMAFLDDIKTKLLKEIKISQEEALDIRMAEQLRLKFIDMGKRMIKEQMPDLNENKLNFIAERVMQEMLGLGELEFLLRDDYIEEICVNTAAEPVWVYHRKFGWLKSNLKIPNEYQVLNYASSIARKVGRQINVQNPLLDAYLVSGDRVNATIYPISAFGNTITIRKFAREPWTITDYIKLKTISSDVAALLWLAMQYEMSLIVAGGTGSGKTSFLNVLSAFIPQNQRIVSIEQTRELSLPSYYQWVPLVVREITSEGRGEISMLDLMVNSLRMRPDRILIGEIRRAEEAQVLFEAMHTGHSVYATLHAETVSETFRRLKNPPINIPGMMLSSLHLIVAMYRDKRRWIRRVFELGEIIPSESGEEDVKAHILYKWKAKNDSIEQTDKSRRIMEYIKTFTNLDDSEIKNTLRERKEILDYMVKKDIKTVDGVGDIISKYYDNPDAVIKMIRK